MTVKIKEITYLIPPRDMLNDALDVLVTLEDEYCTDGFCYFVEVTTPQFLSTMMEKEKSTFLSPDYPCIIVSKLTDDTIQAAIESFINPQEQNPIDPHEELYWLKLYHLTAKLDIEEIDKILYRKKREAIALESEIDTEFEAESDPKN